MLAITAFNGPILIATHKIAPAIAAGTAVVLKPSPRVPRAAVALRGARRAGRLARRCDRGPAGRQRGDDGARPRPAPAGDQLHRRRRRLGDQGRSTAQARASRDGRRRRDARGGRRESRRGRRAVHRRRLRALGPGVPVGAAGLRAGGDSRRARRAPRGARCGGSGRRPDGARNAGRTARRRGLGRPCRGVHRRRRRAGRARRLRRRARGHAGQPDTARGHRPADARAAPGGLRAGDRRRADRRHGRGRARGQRGRRWPAGGRLHERHRPGAGRSPTTSTPAA